MTDIWTAEELRARDGQPPGRICLRIFTKRSPDGEKPDYLVCATAAAEGDGLVGSVSREHEGLPRRIAGASVTRPSERTVQLRFAQSAIGRPSQLRFAVEAVPAGCDPGESCLDLTPNKGRAALLRLRH